MSDGMIGDGSHPAPDLIQAVTGFRGFIVHEPAKGKIEIMSPFQRQRWAEPQAEAVCLRILAATMKDHIPYNEAIQVHGHVPARDCMCGLYAYYDTSVLLRQGNTNLYAMVTLTGRIQAHARGMRAEKMQVRAFALPPEKKIPMGAVHATAKLERARQTYLAEAAAAAFDVPLVPFGALVPISSEYGAPLPEEFRPKDVPKPKQNMAIVTRRAVVRRRRWTHSRILKGWWPGG